MAERGGCTGVNGGNCADDGAGAATGGAAATGGSEAGAPPAAGTPEESGGVSPGGFGGGTAGALAGAAPAAGGVPSSACFLASYSSFVKTPDSYALSSAFICASLLSLWQAAALISSATAIAI